MSNAPDVSGPFAVGLRALHSRALFEQLLHDPRRALESLMTDSELRLTAADVEEVVTLIEAARRKIDPDAALTAWDKYQISGAWRPGWPQGWTC